MPISKKMKLAIVGTLAAVAVVVPLVSYLNSGNKTLETETSPDGRYKLEFRNATQWQVVTHEIADELVYVRLHLPNGKVVDSSPFDVSGVGPTLWTENGGVQVGTTAIYEPQNERWSVDW